MVKKLIRVEFKCPEILLKKIDAFVGDNNSDPRIRSRAQFIINSLDNQLKKSEKTEKSGANKDEL